MSQLIFRSGSTEITVAETNHALDEYLTSPDSIVVFDPEAWTPSSSFTERCIPWPDPESRKTLGGADLLISHLVERHITRRSLIIGIGGGALLDTVGLVASIYHRGTPVIYVPTTLLAQVDAAVGGKTALNYRGTKNLLGTIVHPREIVLDPKFTTELPEERFSEGMAEIIKIALTRDAAFFEWLTSSSAELLKRKYETIVRLISRAVELKCEVVELDERDDDLRLVLNYGHTIGHAIEAVAGIPHGEAVAIGTVVELRVGEKFGFTKAGTAEQTAQLLTKYTLPTSIPKNCTIEEILATARRDKKRVADHYMLPLVQEIGKSTVQRVAIDHYLNALHELQ